MNYTYINLFLPGMMHSNLPVGEDTNRGQRPSSFKLFQDDKMNYTYINLFLLGMVLENALYYLK
jgi:hypothetical protein